MYAHVPVGSIQHEDRAMSNAQALLQSAWLGDAVSVKRYLVRMYSIFTIDLTSLSLSLSLSYG